MIQRGSIFALLSLFLLVLFLPLHVGALYNTPTIGEFEAPNTVYAKKFFLLNATINNPYTVASFVNATVELSNGVVLKWENHTNIFSINSDPNGYCVLDSANSTKRLVNATAYKLSWRIKLDWAYPEGSVSVIATHTKVFDVNGSSGSNSYSGLFTFEHDLRVYLARQGVVTEGLVGFWAFDENIGMTAVDVSKYSNHGTLKPSTTNGPRWTRGKIHSALEFDGIDDYVEVADDPSLDISKALTLEAWVMFEGLPNDHPQIICKGPVNKAYLLWYDNVVAPKGLKFRIYDGTETHTIASGVEPTFGIWHHVVGTFDGSKLKIYVDGKLKGALDFMGSIGITTDPLFIGKHDVGGNLNGVIDEVRIYNRALARQEIKSNYYADHGRHDPSSNLSFKGWLYYEGTTIPPEDTEGITAKVNLGTAEKGTSTTFYSHGLFNLTFTAESNVANYSYTVYASTSVGNTVQNQTVNIIVDRIRIAFTSNGTSLLEDTAVKFTVALTREYDNSSVTDYSYYISRNETAFKSPHTTSTFSDAQSNAIVYIYDFVNMTDHTYGITTFIDPSNITIEWREPPLAFPFWGASIIVVAVIIVIITVLIKTEIIKIEIIEENSLEREK